MKTIFSILFCCTFFQIISAQTSLQGVVADAETGEPIIFGTIALYQKNVLITGTETDFDGFYQITKLDAGTYDVVFSYTGYHDQKVVGVIVASGKTNQLDAKMSAGVTITCCCPCGSYYSPLISSDELTHGFKFQADEIRRIAH